MFKDFGSCEMLPFPPLLPHLLSLLPSLAFKNQTRPELYNLKINNEKKESNNQNYISRLERIGFFLSSAVEELCVCVSCGVDRQRGKEDPPGTEFPPGSQ